MKIIQSLQINSDIADSCGWLSPEFNWMSWALSCLQLNKLHGNIELFTNANGKRVLIDLLKLPYCKVHILNDVPLPHPKLWAYSKLEVYSKQQEPFMHIDGDVFLWERLSDKFLKAPIAVQNLEVDAGGYYATIVDHVNKAGFLQPDCIINQQQQETQLYAYNCGLIGGSDLAVFRQYTDMAAAFVSNNIDKINQLQDPDKLNVFFEQYLLFCLTKQNGNTPECYYHQAVGPMNYKNHFFVNFLDVPYKTKFIHPVGTYKRHLDTCLMLAKRLQKDYPEYFELIMQECGKAKVPTIIRQHHDFKLNRPAPLSFYRTKINIAGFNEETLRNINDDQLTDIIDELSPSEKNRNVLDLYQYEKQLREHTEACNLDILYTQQLRQRSLLEEVFSDTVILHKVTFAADPAIKSIPVNTDYTQRWYLQTDSLLTAKKYAIALPFETLMGTPREVFCDELDLLLLNSIKEPKNVNEIKVSLAVNFDADELTQNPQSFDFLIINRLKYAINNNLVLCRPHKPGDKTKTAQEDQPALEAISG